MRYFKNNFGGYYLEMKAALQAIFPPMRQSQNTHKDFILFGRGRSGSTLLVNMLNAHPDVTCLGEILRYPTLFPLRYIDNCLSQCSTSRRGFKLLSYQIRSMFNTPNQRRLRHWLEQSQITIFHLKRNNLLRHAVSNIYAARRGIYHSSDRNTAGHAMIEIEPEELFLWMTGSQHHLDWEMNFLDGLDRLEIAYENDLEQQHDQERTLKISLEKLELPPLSVKPTLAPVTPRNFARIIRNWSELESAIQRSQFTHFLDY